MSYLLNGTICSKHDKLENIISDLKIEKEVKKELLKIVELALKDGQRMESKIHKRKQEVEELNKKIDKLEDNVESLKNTIEDLEQEIVNLERNQD